MSAPPTQTPDFEVAIVGSGFSGLGMAIQLKKAGRASFVVLEKASAVGGTWRENRYPGCACDIPSHLYSFSFAPNPAWTRRYAPRAEIQAYLDDCAERFGIRPHIRFDCEVLRAEFDERRLWWTVTTRVGTLTARHLVLGVGALSRPALPTIRGLASFEGSAFHSAQWDPAVALDDKRVAVVGTGASAIQLVPQLAPRVSALHVYQRTPPWVLPHPDRPVTEFARALFRAAPPLQRLTRDAIYLQHELRGLGFTVDPRIMHAARWLGLRHIRKQIVDPALRAKVTPSYLPGCKRVLMSNTYYRALTRPNVDLITSGIAEITARGIVDASGVEHAVDAIVFGTGFAVRDFLAPMQVVGRGGAELNALWRSDRVEAYRGTTIAGFPNLYMLMGPNTGLGHNSMIFMIEAQIGYVRRCMAELDARGARCADVLPEAQRAYNDRLQPRLKRSVWASGCSSWYLDAHGQNATLWPGFTFEFWFKSRRFQPRDHTFDPSSPKEIA